jgi:hypothetical protein
MKLRMPNPILTGLEIGAASGCALSTGLGIYLLARLRSAGGLELGLAHVVANSERRRTFILTVGVSFGAFVAAGLVDTLSDLIPSWDTIADFIVAIFLLAGGLGLLVLIAGALRPDALTLAEEWNLAESAARTSANTPDSDRINPPR